MCFETSVVKVNERKRAHFIFKLLEGHGGINPLKINIVPFSTKYKKGGNCWHCKSKKKKTDIYNINL